MVFKKSFFRIGMWHSRPLRRRVVVMMSAVFHIENLGYVMKMVQQVNSDELDKVSTMVRDV